MKNKNMIIFSVKQNVMYHPLIAAGLILSVAGAVVTALLPPLILEKIINRFSVKGEFAVSLALIYFITLAVSGITDALKEILITVFGQKITHTVRSEMCSKLSRLPASYYSENEPGITTSRFVGDVDTVETLFSSGIVGMFADACKIISILTVVFFKSTGLGIMLLIAAPIIFIFTRSVQKKMLSAQIKNRKSIGRLSNYLPETIRNIRMIHVFHREKYMENKYDSMVEKSYNAVEKANFYDAVYSPVILIINSVIIAVMMVLAATGGQMQSFFGMSVGTAVAVIAYVGKVFDPIENIGMEIQTVQSAIAGVRRVNEFMNEPERKVSVVSGTDYDFKSDKVICCEDASFFYDDDVPVLQNLSFEVKRGEFTTISGRTGAGKSTLFKLILGFYHPQNGCINVFGVDAGDIPDTEKRKLFGYVSQSFRPVPGSIYDQIAVYDKKIDRTAAQKSAMMAGIHDFIVSLPDGYDTTYTDNIFSQGQKQLIAIARAVASDPEILLLDEITANLDSQTEKRVLSALEKACENKTVVSISHRLYEHSGGRIINI